jgi:flagellar basal-body rod protein FlgG
MMRSLYTAATGMEAQQLNMDVISNNLANVNTTGFKHSRADFSDLIYQQMRPAGTQVADGAQSPTGLEVGLGVRPAGTETMFEQGTLQETTGNPFDVAIQGQGFFKVLTPDGSLAYTRDGSFKNDGTGKLVDNQGNALQPEIVVPANATSITIGTDGTVSASQGSSTSTAPQVLGKITLTRFINPAGLQHLGGNDFAATPASGTPTDGTPGQDGFGTIAQNSLEGSNVQIVQEMVSMITAQRAYEVNSKAIQTADNMLATANQLRQ